jgi:hypothetical protein
MATVPENIDKVDETGAVNETGVTRVSIYQ